MIIVVSVLHTFMVVDTSQCLLQEFEAVSHEFADHLAHLLISLHTSVKGGSHTSSICNDIEENILVLVSDV